MAPARQAGDLVVPFEKLEDAQLNLALHPRVVTPSGPQLAPRASFDVLVGAPGNLNNP